MQFLQWKYTKRMLKTQHCARLKLKSEKSLAITPTGPGICYTNSAHEKEESISEACKKSIPPPCGDDLHGGHIHGRRG